MRKIRYGLGLEVFCNEVITQDDTIVALSMVGRESPLTAVIAAIVDTKPVTLKCETGIDETLFRPKATCSFKRIPLGDNMYQGIFYNKDEMDHITSRSDFFLTLNTLFHVPLHESWAEFIFKKALADEWILKLKAYSEFETEKNYYKIGFNQSELESMIQTHFETLKNLIN
jgi:hypothetical protein